MTDSSATLQWNNEDISLPAYPATLGPAVVDVSTLQKQGLFTYDPGFMSTAACKSAITYIDGDQGILLHRGYPIDQLAEKHDFLDVSYLLLNGELPNADQKRSFNSEIAAHMQIDPQVAAVFTGFSQDAHPMGMLIAAMGSLASYYRLKSSDPGNRRAATFRLIAQIPVIAAQAYRHLQGKVAIAPNPDLDYSANFLYMMFGDEQQHDAATSAALTRAIDKILILHADHEQNASTSTMRMVGSTGANPFACVAAGIAALWGPAHGGANEACLKMLQDMGDESKIPEYIKRAKDKSDPFRLMGFGHRVYKNFDPRAKVMRTICHEVLDALGLRNNPLFKLATSLEKIALEDSYFIERKLYANVDFYSGITLSALGIPTNMFTVMFALARTVGWLAHWREMRDDPEFRIARPRQLYIGEKERNC
jgi:citrate synthase